MGPTGAGATKVPVTTVITAGSVAVPLTTAEASGTVDLRPRVPVQLITEWTPLKRSSAEGSDTVEKTAA